MADARGPRVLYACFGKAGLDCLYQLLNCASFDENNLLVATYSVEDYPENADLVRQIDILGISTITLPLNHPKVEKQIAAFAPDFLFSVYYRDIIGVSLLKLVGSAAINLHPSLLPKHRGCFSAPWALIEGDTEAGVSFHYMEATVDTGNILLQASIPIWPSETAFSLYHRLVALGVRTFASAYDLAVHKHSLGTPQTTREQAHPRKLPYDGYIDLSWGRTRIHRFIRAMYFPPHSGAKLIYGKSTVEFQVPEDFDTFCHKNDIELAP